MSKYRKLIMSTSSDESKTNFEQIDLDIVSAKIIMSNKIWSKYRHLPCYIIIVSSPKGKHSEALDNATLGPNPDDELEFDKFYKWDKETDIFTWRGHERYHNTKWFNNTSGIYKNEMGPEQGIYDSKFQHTIGYRTSAEDIMNNTKPSDHLEPFKGLYSIYECNPYWWDRDDKLKAINNHYNFCFSSGVVRRLLTLIDNTKVVGIYLECLQAESG